MKTTLEQHIAYSKSPELFMKEKWLTFDVFNRLADKNIKPFDYQLDFIKNIHKINRNIVVKSRQMHVSSMMALYIAWYALFNCDKKIAIMSYSGNSGAKILESIKVILQNYYVIEEENEKIKTYFHWKDDFIKSNQKELSLKNGCTIKVLSPTICATCGEAIDLAFFDEAAFIKDFKTIWMCFCPMFDYKNSQVIISSNPKDDSFFNELVLNFDSQYGNIIRLHWSIHPKRSHDLKKNIDINSPFEYTSPWFESTCKQIGGNINLIEQELECVVRYKERSNKNKTISIRLNSELYKKISAKIHGKESASDYIRNLIERDLRDYL